MTDSKDLKDRTRRFAVRIIRMVDKLPRSIASEVIARQLVRSATSIGANYRAASRGRSKAEFIAKLQIVLEESDETQYWLELLLEVDLLDRQALQELSQEADELTAIFVSALKTARSREKSIYLLTSSFYLDMPPSSRGLGHELFKLGTRVRISLGVQQVIFDC